MHVETLGDRLVSVRLIITFRCIFNVSVLNPESELKKAPLVLLCADGNVVAEVNNFER